MFFLQTYRIFGLVIIGFLVAFLVFAYTYHQAAAIHVTLCPCKAQTKDDGNQLGSGHKRKTLSGTAISTTDSHVNNKQSTNTDSLLFPCLADVSTPPDMGRYDGCVRTVNMNLTSELIKKEDCVPLVLPNAEISMCIHDPRRDRIISASVLQYGVWEEDLLTKMLTVLNKYPDMDLLDIGCDIGAYTLAAATSGARVVAVDANKVNLILLSKSVILGQLQDHVTLVWNALSSKYDKMFMDEWKFNIGGNKVKTYDEKQTPSPESILTESVRLDDLQELFINRTVFIKIDVEEHEVKVFDGGADFLGKVNVRFIQMEYGYHREKPSGKLIVKRLKKLGFRPFIDCLGKEPLSVRQIEQWPWDICFVKSKLRKHVKQRGSV